MLSRTSRAGPLRTVLCHTTPSCSSTLSRQFTSTTPRSNNKPSISNIAEIRKLLPGTTMIKAREALTSSNNDIQTALAWLERDVAISGVKKASKVGERLAKEGGIGINIIVDGAPKVASSSSETSTTMSARAGIVELNCETDFVGRNEIFQSLLGDIAHTVALFPTLAMGEGSSSSSNQSNLSQEIIDISPTDLLAFPLMSSTVKEVQNTSGPRTVGDAILDVISRLGERIHLARASALSNAAIPAVDAPRRSQSDQDTPWLVASAFTHGGVSQQPSSNTSPILFSSTGKVGSLLLTQFKRPRIAAASSSRRDEKSLLAMRAMARSLARQAAGMPTSRVKGNDKGDETSLYNQSFIMKLKAANLQEGESTQSEGEEIVETALTSWGKVWMNGQVEAETVSVLALRRWELGEEFEGRQV